MLKEEGISLDEHTTAQRDALVNPDKGLLIYNTTTSRFESNDGTPSVPVWNPSGLPTKTELGLGNVDNTSDVNKPISTATQNSLNIKADLVGGLIPSNQLPSYVDDILEYANLGAFPGTGEAGKVYIALDTDKVYRWATSVYVVISDTLSATDVKSLYESNANTEAYTTTEQTKLGNISVTQAVNLDTIETDTATNNAKVSFPEAPNDAKKYVRESLGWIEIIESASSEQAVVQVSKSSTLVVTSTPVYVDFTDADVENLPAQVSWDIANPERITVLQDGVYMVGASISADNSVNTNETLMLDLFLNGVTSGEVINTIITKNASASINPSRIVELSANDYLGFKASETTGSGDITIKANAKFSLIRLTGEKGDVGATGSGSNIIVQDEGVTQGTVIDTIDFIGPQVQVTESGGKATVNTGIWQPPQIQLSDLATSGVTIYALTGAGLMFSFDGSSDDNALSNIGLDTNGISYDGSNLKLVVVAKTSSTPSASDNVKIDTSYAFVVLGDNAQTKGTTFTETIVVDGETQDLSFQTTWTTVFTGVANATHLQTTILRNSVGGGEDTYAGDWELLTIKLTKV